MKSVSDMKRRLAIGQRLLCVENTYRPELNGTIRTIIRVLGNQIVWTWNGGQRPGQCPNWTRWPHAKMFTFVDADTFSFALDEKHTVTLRFIGSEVLE